MNSFLDISAELFNFNSGQWGWWILAIADILFLAFIIYQVYRILMQTKATQLLQGLVILFAVYLIAKILHLGTVLWLINKLGTVIVIAVLIVYQPELRKIFSRVARVGFFRSSKAEYASHIDSILEAIKILSENRRGALIVFERKVSLKDLSGASTLLHSDISTNLLLTIFQHNTALHDGAVIIRNGRIESAGSMLPMSEQSDIAKTFGSRHRAALGISENSDAIVLICSEETGATSLAYESNLYYDLSLPDIKRTLLEYLDGKTLGFEEENDSEVSLED